MTLNETIQHLETQYDELDSKYVALIQANNILAIELSKSVRDLPVDDAHRKNIVHTLTNYGYRPES